MPKSLLLLAPLVSLAALVLMGARRGPDMPEPPSPFVAGPVALDRAVVGAAATGAQLLDRAARALAPDHVRWLHTAVWQKRATFEAHGTLTRGPHDCARLALTVRTVHGPSELLVVCDGTALAQVVQVAGGPTDVQSDLLPAGAARVDFLQEKGCGGPAPVLAALGRGLRAPTVRTGQLRGRRVIEVAGELDPAQVAESARPAMPAERGTAYLDAQTLWPHRLEWHGRDRQGQLRTVFQMEYRDPEVNRELPPDECARLFTYQPEEGP